MTQTNEFLCVKIKSLICLTQRSLFDDTSFVSCSSLEVRNPGLFTSVTLSCNGVSQFVTVG